MATYSKKSTSAKSFDNLTLLSKWLISDKEFNIDTIINDPNSSSYKYRVINYLLKYPRILLYINNYLNNIYQFDNDKYSTQDWLNTFKLIIKQNNFNSLNRLYFNKFKPAKRISFKNEIREYELSVNNRIVSEDELNELYRLYTLKILSDDHLNEIKAINAGKELKSSKLPFDNIETLVNPSPVKIEFNAPIVKFNETIINYIKSRSLCKNCPLYNAPKYPIVSNIKNEKDQLDVIIVGEFPNNENFIEDNRHIKLLIDKYNLNYLATNLVLCKPNNGEIPNTLKTIANCKEVTNHIYKQFKSNFKILIGTNAKKTFGIGSTTTKVNGEMINDCFIVAGPSNNSQFKAALIKLNSYLEKYSKDKLSRINIEQSAVESNNLDISADLKNYTLFDIKIVNEQLLYILIENGTGNKKYISENISFPVYLKKGNFRQCDYFVDDCDFVVYLSNQQKMNLSQQMKRKLSSEVLI